MWSRGERQGRVFVVGKLQPCDVIDDQQVAILVVEQMVFPKVVKVQFSHIGHKVSQNYTNSMFLQTLILMNFGMG